MRRTGVERPDLSVSVAASPGLIEVCHDLLEPLPCDGFLGVAPSQHLLRPSVSRAAPDPSSSIAARTADRPQENQGGAKKKTKKTRMKTSDHSGNDAHDDEKWEEGEDNGNQRHGATSHSPRPARGVDAPPPNASRMPTSRVARATQMIAPGNNRHRPEARSFTSYLVDMLFLRGGRSKT
jgi:hypothetical protein